MLNAKWPKSSNRATRERKFTLRGGTELRQTDFQHDLSLSRSPMAGQQKQPNQQSHSAKSAKCLLTNMKAINLPWALDGQDGNLNLTEDGNAVMRIGDAPQKVSGWSSVEKGKGKGSWKSFLSLLWCGNLLGHTHAVITLYEGLGRREDPWGDPLGLCMNIRSEGARPSTIG